VSDLHRVRPSLGTLVSVRAVAEDAHIARRAIEAAFGAIDRVDRLMHPSRAGSDLVRLRNVGVVEVDRWTWEVLQAAACLNAESNGLFEPCLAEVSGTMADLRLVEPNRVETGRSCAIDLGGIAKGYAVDRAIEALRECGCSTGEVNAGGDLRVFGPSDREIWIRAQGAYGRIRLRDAACAVSDAPSMRRPREHRGYYRFGSDESFVGSAAIIAPTALWADAIATYAMLCRSPGEHARLDHVLALHGALRLYRSTNPSKKSPQLGRPIG
jgi:FAD:protein FMN transferase